MHALADTHDTPDSWPAAATVGLGVLWIAQLVPSHRSANDPWLGTLLLEFSPTAVHALADTHDTPDSWTKSAPAGLGVVWIAQLVPSHRSANDTLNSMPPAPPLYWQPTAVHALADTHDTPSSWTRSRPVVGLGAVWIAQLVASHRSTNGRYPALLLK